VKRLLDRKLQGHLEALLKESTVALKQVWFRLHEGVAWLAG